ncbi:MAG: DUF2339 domain-containing protein [Campylobacteraceae bacterium]|jgi:uncharacterized membrane protein|nr:DUF2339 domain-containing protein [Campylobacteraceae bacterium]
MEDLLSFIVMSGFVSILVVVAMIAFPIIVIIMINNLKQRVKYIEKILQAQKISVSDSIKPEVKSAQTPALTETAKAPSYNAVSNSSEPLRLKKLKKPTAQPSKNEDTQFNNVSAKFINWLSDNIVAKIAVIILFFGIAFLLKYSIDHNLLSLQIRVLGSLILGFVLFGIGWRLRNTKRLYSLILEGGAIGVLYLTIFAAFKIYAFIPIAAAFGLLIFICALGVYFAVLQNASALAVLAFSGAYLSPVLLSSGKGEHIVLFSCYTVISLALIIISRWRSWRALNLIGFAFTAVVTLLWYLKSYKVEFYPETQAFIAVNLIIFGILAVLLFIRRERQSVYHNVIDIALLFGVPILSYALEYRILMQWRFAAAFAALAFALFYIIGSFCVFKKFKDVGKRAALYMLAISIGFATLAVPLAFDNDLTSLIWLFEGSAITWAALRNKQYKLGYFGLLITMFGVILTMYENQNAFISYHYSQLDGALYAFVIAYGIMSAVLFFNACLLYSFKTLHVSLKNASFVMLVFAALSWIYWAFGSSDAISYLHFNHDDGFRYTYFLLAFIFLSWFWYFVGRAMKWEILECALVSLWPALVIALWHLEKSLLLDASYILAFASAYVYLYKGSFFRKLHKNVEPVLHISLFWVFLLWIHGKLDMFIDPFMLYEEREYFVTALFCAVFAAVILAVYAFQKKSLFPFGRFAFVYWRIGLAPVLLYLVVKLLGALFIGVWWFELQYVPILNPLEESIIFTLIVLKFYIDRTFAHIQKRSVFFVYLFFAVLCFLEMNGVILRTLSYFLDIPWSFRFLWNSEAVQSVFSIIWTLLALALIIFANRSKNRKIWFIGMALLVIVVAKLVLHDSVKLEGLFRAFVFIGVALLMLVIGFLAPMPPKENINIKKD